MGRPARYDGADIVAGAKEISVDIGPQKLTVAAVARRTGVPVGSIYHRYASRDEILAAVWLDLVEEFQARFLAALEADDAVEAGLDAVRDVVAWVRRHPREARLLLLHRREDFAAERWPASYRRRAEGLATRAAASMSRYTARLTGRSGAAALRHVRFALVDLPTATLKRDIEAGERPTPSTERLLLDTCAYALRRVGAPRKSNRKTTTDEHR
jgi:AcrR family transcriptional regulator